MFELYVCLCFIFLMIKKARWQVINLRKKEKQISHHIPEEKKCELPKQNIFPIGQIVSVTVLLKDSIK